MTVAISGGVGTVTTSVWVLIGVPLAVAAIGYVASWRLVRQQNRRDNKEWSDRRRVERAEVMEEIAAATSAVRGHFGTHQSVPPTTRLRSAFTRLYTRLDEEQLYRGAIAALDAAEVGMLRPRFWTEAVDTIELRLSMWYLRRATARDIGNLLHRDAYDYRIGHMVVGAGEGYGPFPRAPLWRRMLHIAKPGAPWTYKVPKRPRKES